MANNNSTNTYILASANREVTMPSQPAFLAYNSVTDANQTGNGASATVEFDTEVYDQNADFNTTTDTFTAPVTGKYPLSSTIVVIDLTVAMTNSYIGLVTSNRSYYTGYLNPGACKNSVNDGIYYTINTIADMDAADTATITIVVAGGAGDTAGIVGTAGSVQCYFTGTLIC